MPAPASFRLRKTQLAPVLSIFTFCLRCLGYVIREFANSMLVERNNLALNYLRVRATPVQASPTSLHHLDREDRPRLLSRLLQMPSCSILRRSQ